MHELRSTPEKFRCRYYYYSYCCKTRFLYATLKIHFRLDFFLFFFFCFLSKYNLFNRRILFINELPKFILIRWIREVYQKAWNRPLEEKDIYETLDIHESKQLSDRFSRKWEIQLRQPKPSLGAVICQIYGYHILWTSILFTIIDTASKYGV